MTGKLLDLSLLLNGKQRLTIELDGDARQMWDKLHSEIVDVDIKKHREKRSLSANAYAWVLIDKIAAVTRQSKTEVYRRYIKDVPGSSDTVCVVNEAVDKVCRSWQDHGLGWQTEIADSKIDGCTNIILHYGSSVFDTAQMSLLIDLIVQDCRALDIETKDENEIKSLLEAWE